MVVCGTPGLTAIWVLQVSSNTLLLLPYSSPCILTGCLPRNHRQIEAFASCQLNCTSYHNQHHCPSNAEKQHSSAHMKLSSACPPAPAGRVLVKEASGKLGHKLVKITKPILR